MTQTKENVWRTTEFDTLFMNLNEKGQEAALTILKSLDFAQSVMNVPRAENQRNLTKQFV